MIITNVISDLKIGITSSIEILGFNFYPGLSAQIVTADGREVYAVNNIYVTPLKSSLSWQPQNGDRHRLNILDLDNNLIESIDLQIEPEIERTSSVEQMRSQKIILTDDLDRLVVGNSELVDGQTPDIRYYKNVPPRTGYGGIQTTKKGYLAFPNLAWDTELEMRSVSFIYYVGNDSRYFVFGLAGDRYRWDSNEYNRLEIGVRVRSYRGLYGYYGLSLNGTYTYTGYRYSSLESYRFYNLTIYNNGEKKEAVEITQIQDQDYKNWFTGEVVAKDILPYPPSRSSKIVVPGVWDYLGSKNAILGCVVR